MFKPDNTDIEIRQRLKILYFLSFYHTPIKKEDFIDVFLNIQDNYIELHTLIESMITSQLIQYKNATISISDNGLVTLSFFKDRLEESDLKEVENLIQTQRDLIELPIKLIEYDPQKELWHMSIIKNNKIVLEIYKDSQSNPFEKFENISAKEILDNLIIDIEKK